MIASLKSLLKTKDYDAAFKYAAENSNVLDRREVEFIFNEYPPQPEPCPKCGEPIRNLYYHMPARYMPVRCENCQKLEVEKKLSNNLVERLLNYGIAKRFLNAKLNDFNSDIQKAATGENGLFITGPRGTGKTHFLSGIIADIISQLPLHISKDQDGRIYYFPPESKEYPLLVNVPKLLMKIKL